MKDQAFLCQVQTLESESWTKWKWQHCQVKLKVKVIDEGGQIEQVLPAFLWRVKVKSLNIEIEN